MRRLISLGLVLLVAGVARGEASWPTGLQPGDTYHIIFATSFMTGVTNNTSVPPLSSDIFGGMPAADWVVTMAVNDAAYGAQEVGNPLPLGLDPAAYFGMPLDEWNGVTATWTAILSTPAEYARDRVAITGPLYNTHGDLIATDHADLWDGELLAPVAYDEYGNALEGSMYVWTGSTFTGNVQGGSTANFWDNSTSSFNAEVGLGDESNWRWISANQLLADQTARLYGVSPPITFVPEPSALVLFAAGAIALSARAWRRRMRSA